MHLFRWGLIVAGLIIVGAALYQTMLWLGIWGNPHEAQVLPLDHDDQEIALIEPATNSDDWGRIVTAVKLLERDWPIINPRSPPLRITLDEAFPRLTAAVPEIVLSLGTTSGQLRLRWYKISGEHDAASWIAKLRARPRPPLAVIGGGSSERGVRLAVALKKSFAADPGSAAPVLLLTTATAEKTSHGKPLIRLYQGRTFRFSFTNQKMVEALLQFVQRRRHDKNEEWAQNLWVHKPADPQMLTNAVASMASAGEVWYALGILRALPHLQPYTMHAVAWQDERYSQEMTDLFEQAFKNRYPLSEFFPENTIRFGVGGFYEPSPEEQNAVGTFLGRLKVTPHSFLVLPTQTVRMRRFLINLRERSPLDARNLVILNGDGIAFQSVYRDREVVWNLFNLPYSLVFFSHRNPIDHAAGFTWKEDDRKDVALQFPQQTTTGTQDILLYRDIFEALVYAAHEQGALLGDAERLRDRLRATRWRVPADAADSPRIANPESPPAGAQHIPFFDADGNRNSRTGEHIVWVKPDFTEDRVDLTSKISVWALSAGGDWQLVEAFDATYNQSRQEENMP
jgi:hypothetical protein